MTDIAFGRLIDLPLREAWPHEAHAFTPWLARNIDHLSEAIGLPLELTGTEVAVETFSADILARNPQDGGVVLIENQLETTDHTHLGQIMTYLAGLEAETVIWIAPAFREPHLSAIRWLNEHTADGFAFFAVRLRVVRIGDSPFAPVFEIVEKPNGWDRRLERTVRQASGEHSPLGDQRERFWSAYLDRHPEAGALGFRVTRSGNNYQSLLDGDVRISAWIGERQGGTYVGGRHGDKMSAAGRLADVGAEIGDALGVTCDLSDPSGHILGERVDISWHDEATWPELIDQLETLRRRYAEAITAAIGKDA
ncbi:hypothetical protein [Jannaschia formosa]|uniref:hypothetical protein n=1 Tax=Jannaschia formosa TaxID=2259592 RepID=UPI000E1C2DE7|nr:hypothetical protein [Jannaschia formosa]TFL16708.1 hypothetical protein DR046_18730 [Jannaschia formosa]